ncbi:hypothetical protein ACMXYR_05490 [Neptuniibacter sp. QD29_5]|uniref:hypothetical protein n=1 Tax=Neptuniibacter sp. QD29_5 TaxID=3398207 RepID=UPI0039F4B872
MYNRAKTFQCTYCASEIASIADFCPQCGAPNEWIHPRLVEFLEVKSTEFVPQECYFKVKHDQLYMYVEDTPGLWAYTLLGMLTVLFLPLALLYILWWVYKDDPSHTDGKKYFIVKVDDSGISE